MDSFGKFWARIISGMILAGVWIRGLGFGLIFLVFTLLGLGLGLLLGHLTWIGLGQSSFAVVAFALIGVALGAGVGLIVASKS